MRPVVGERGFVVVLVAGGDGDDILAGCRVGGAGGVVVPRRGDDDHATVEGVVDGILQGGRAVVAAQAQVDHPRPVVGGVGDAADDVGVRACARGVQGLHGHHLGVVGDAGYSYTVVGEGGDGAGDVGAVAVVVCGVAVVAHEVVPGDQLAGQVGVGGVSAGVHDGDDHAAACGQVPGLGELHLGQVPLLAEQGVVGG